MRNIKLTALTAMPAAPVLELFERYVFGDWEFVKFLVVLVVVDTILGFVKHLIEKDVSSKAYGMIAKKLLIYSSILAVSHVLSNFSINGEIVDSFVWFRYFACSALMIREGISIIENSEEIYPGLFPKWVVTKLKGFDNITGEKKHEENKSKN